MVGEVRRGDMDAALLHEKRESTPTGHDKLVATSALAHRSARARLVKFAGGFGGMSQAW